MADSADEKKPVTPRHSSTVMLLRDTLSGPEVYVQERASTMAFCAEMTVFPGGGVDSRDMPGDVDGDGQPSPEIRWQGQSTTWWAERLAIAGGLGTLLGGRNRVVAAASGAALLTASALTRFGVLHAGLESVKDPRRVIEPQKARLAARRAAGITDDAITTAG